MTKQIEETMMQIRDCNFSSLSPQGAQAVWSILALSPYDTEEGRALQTKLKDIVPHSHISETPEATSSKITQSALNQARRNLLHSVHPSADTLVAYYNLLVRLHPDRKATDSADLYQEFLKILLNAYSNTRKLSTSWWQMKSILEHYYHSA